MGTNFMRGGGAPKVPRIQVPGQNIEARSFGAPNFTSVRSGGAATKDIAAAAAMVNAHKMKPTTGSAAYAPGPKKV